MQLFKVKKIKILLFCFLIFAILFVNERSLILQAPAGGAIDYLPQTDCGVVLTGSPGRIREAFEILALKKIKKLIVSGVYRETKLHEIFPQLPYYPEIKIEDIILEKISGTTYENAVQSQLLVEKLKCQSILLITSQLHMYRANKTFKTNYNKNIEIRNYSISNPLKEDKFFDEFIETIKSLFYSVLLFVTKWS